MFLYIPVVTTLGGVIIPFCVYKNQTGRHDRQTTMYFFSNNWKPQKAQTVKSKKPQQPRQQQQQQQQRQ
jgi:hypothetical protein